MKSDKTDGIYSPLKKRKKKKVKKKEQTKLQCESIKQST